MKKIGLGILSVCAILFTMSLWQSRSAHSYDQNDDMTRLVSQAFAATGATQSGYNVHDWTVIDQNYHSEADLRTYSQKLNDLIHIENPSTYSSSDGSRNVYQIRGSWGTSTKVSMILTSMKFPGSNPQTTLVIRAESKSGNRTQLSNDIEKIKKTTALTNVRPQISTCIEGFVSDRMNKVETNALISKTFKSVQATEVEGVKSDLVTSISAYSPMSQDYILTNGKKMNLQVAVHYDSYRHRTQVLVGSPIVTIEY
ncbi:YwmB family TATA-box binding protein [Fodinisporobacter ferrooxydans]|uniref:YwmB family TATA-box binding protein n=1 Tax=Fodinisporobacter ferrooxydans TaxID=2901836 RepID=A0ABY4CMN9_9BACL|nr:YwmB family TATA-box binding protein [Alicyclobacillaceae bacterium MYW30-H2]